MAMFARSISTTASPPAIRSKMTSFVNSGPTGMQIASARVNMELGFRRMYFGEASQPRMVSTGLDGVILWLLAAERANKDDTEMLQLLESVNFPCLKRTFDPNQIHVELVVVQCPLEKRLPVLERVFKYSGDRLPSAWPLKLEYHHTLDPHNHGTFEKNNIVSIKLQEVITVASVNPMEHVVNALKALCDKPVTLEYLETDNKFIIATLIGRIYAILRSRDTKEDRLRNNKPFAVDESLHDLARLFSTKSQYLGFSKWLKEVVKAIEGGIDIEQAATWSKFISGENEDAVRRLKQLKAVFERLLTLFNRAALNEVQFSTQSQSVHKIPSYPINPHETVSRRPSA
ncbi:hypothetical protein JCM5350_002219 [Sporobolomyces pararoseus]